MSSFAGSAYPRFCRAMADLRLPLRSRVRVAWSGGPDSTALLYLIIRWVRAHRTDVMLSVGHVNHGIRATEADLDEAHCRGLALDLGLDLSVSRVDALAHAHRRRLSVETAAREQRLACFARWAREDRLSHVCTGHTADDQVETVLGNICRGSGLTGLRGMPTARTIPNTPGTILIRPLLCLRREELLAVLARHGAAWRQDSSNLDLTHRRNRLRRLLIPLLEEHFNPGIQRAVLDLAREARELHALREQQLIPALETVDRAPGFLAIPTANVRHLPTALCAALLDRLWHLATGRTTGLNHDQHRAWARICRAEGPGHRYCLPGDWLVERVGDQIYLLQGDVDIDDPVEKTLQPREGTVELDWLSLELRVWEPPAGGADAAELPRRWFGGSLRAHHRDDVVTISMGHGKVSELLRKAGVPDRLRSHYPVLVMDREVMWIPGIRRATLSAADGVGPTLNARVHVRNPRSWPTFLLDRILSSGQDKRGR